MQVNHPATRIGTRGSFRRKSIENCTNTKINSIIKNGLQVLFCFLESRFSKKPRHSISNSFHLISPLPEQVLLPSKSGFGWCVFACIPKQEGFFAVFGFSSLKSFEVRHGKTTMVETHKRNNLTGGKRVPQSGGAHPTPQPIELESGTQPPKGPGLSPPEPENLLQPCRQPSQPPPPNALLLNPHFRKSFTTVCRCFCKMFWLPLVPFGEYFEQVVG